MKRVLEASRYMSLLAVVSLAAAAVGAFIWGTVSAFTVLVHLIEHAGEPPLFSVDLVALMDKFLLASALLLFAVGLYELFIGELYVPAWLEIRNLHDLKTRLASVVILVMAVTFLEHLIEWTDPKGLLYFAGAIALVSASLIAFAQFGEKE
ncbi:MAG: YqhA family protein [Anaerolineales bacterium]|nr:YqhA family protein [Anaerolineales bacterium]